jgi:hypothetical protein
VRAAIATIGLTLTLAGALGCRNNTLLDVAMSSAPRAAAFRERVGPWELLAGDLHTHVLPPDAPYHVSRNLLETVSIALEERLDFVVLTPHVPSRFYLHPEKREWVRGTQRVLQAQIAAVTRDGADTSVLLVPGMEYTDHRFGHVGLAFADVDEVLDELPIADLAARPELFFEAWQAHGGVAAINHPVLRPIPTAPVPELRADLSWRGFPLAGSVEGAEVAPEIRWLSRHAQTIETHNASVEHLRDQFFMSDRDWTLREATHLVDREARRQRRRITPVGGSDSHGLWLRPTTWVLASERSTAALRDAIVAGRTCVRGPEACLLEVRAGDGACHFVGASIATAAPVRAISARALRGPTTWYVNGVATARSRAGEAISIPMSGRCTLVRATVGRSVSAPIYVDCPWANPSSPVTGE